MFFMNEKFDKNKVSIIIRDQQLFNNLAEYYEKSKADNKSQFICELLEAGLQVIGDYKNIDNYKEMLIESAKSVVSRYNKIIDRLDIMMQVLEKGFKILINNGNK